MTGMRKKDGDSEGDSGFVTPDSTTREKVPQFCVGEDVLSHGKDGIYYLGIIVLVDVENERCLVQFEDRTAHWSLFKDITKFRIPESDELCVICKSSKSWASNEIVLCFLCDQGYHQKCLQPEINCKYCEPDSQWECPKCSCESVLLKEEKKKSKESSPRKLKAKPIQSDEDYKQSLPYDLNALTWDIGHKTNKEQTYCYCGGPGEWYNRMLQCQRCKQWFHEACVECLHIPLLYGDRFYVFLCNICNSGSEFIHRLDVKWVDVVHLAMFILTLQESKMFFEYDSGITQWINDNWELLQCPLGLQNLRVSERKHEVIRILEANRPRFKCGRECHKRASLWALRVRVPPPVPIITLPQHEVITEESLKKMVLRHKTCNSPPISRCIKLREEKTDNMEDLMNRYSPAKKRASSPSVHLSQEEEEEEIEIELDNFEDDERAAEGHCKRKRKRELDILMEDKKDERRLRGLQKLCLRLMKMTAEIALDAKKMIEDIGSLHMDVPSGMLIDSVGYGSVQDESTAEGKRKRGRPPKRAEMSQTQPGKSLRELQHRRSNLLFTDNYKEIKVQITDNKPSEEYSTVPANGDTSGDDTSSHGTLESFIPPPTNFEGHNHPFLNLDSLSYGVPIIRPLKRKLNESDIKIGKNGEVKRRRFRRKLDKSKHSCLMQTFLAAPIMRVCGAASIRNCVDYALSGRLQQAKSESEGCTKEESGFSLSDLKSSVNTYFGAAHRIANGEKFHILAKRTVSDQKIQFLIEWETPNSS